MLQGRVSTCENDIEKIQADLLTLRTEFDSLVSDLLQKIESIVVLPSHPDGSVDVKQGYTNMDFEIRPLSVAGKLAEMGVSVFTLSTIPVQTKASSRFTNIPIYDVAFDGEVITIEVQGKDFGTSFFDHTVELSARLLIKNSTNEKASGFFPLFPTSDYVDLGLSVKWANCNLGAMLPEEQGKLYAWGETTTKTDFSWETYKWYKSGSTKADIQYSKYNSTSAIIAREDDAASVLLGGNWHTPTWGELNELFSHCSWTAENVNGVDGWRITSTVPGYTKNSIFLPAGRLYWTSTADYNDKTKAYSLFITKTIHQSSNEVRYYGMAIRPVFN